jgi:hypothetical protein
MIQRKQSLFLLLAALSGIALYFFPLVSFLSDLNYFKLYVYEFKNMSPNQDVTFGIMTIIPLIVISVGIVGLSLFTILKYKNRILQVRLVRFTMLLTIFFVAGVFFLYPRLAEQHISTEPVFEMGAYLPIGILLFLYLANIFILKDEKLVRSIDRLR